MNELIHPLMNGNSLTIQESEKLFSEIIEGRLNDIEITALLTALKLKGEQPEEIAGAVLAFRKAALFFPKQELLLGDCCGTGGDGSHTINISTATAFLAAACGLTIAKHGNRSVSSKCGSADVLEQLGYQINQSPDESQQHLKKQHICFLFAPSYHLGVKHVMPVRNTLKERTIFNIIGPLINPAQPDYQLIGVYDPALCKPVAKTLKLLGCKSALVVHGSGLDEIAIHAPTKAIKLSDNQLEDMTINPQDFFKQSYSLEDIKGGKPEQNSEQLLSLLQGNAPDAHNAAVAINTGALLWISGMSQTLQEGYNFAADVLKSGKAGQLLNQFIKSSTHVEHYH